MLLKKYQEALRQAVCEAGVPLTAFEVRHTASAFGLRIKGSGVFFCIHTNEATFHDLRYHVTTFTPQTLRAPEGADVVSGPIARNLEQWNVKLVIDPSNFCAYAKPPVVDTPGPPDAVPFDAVLEAFKKWLSDDVRPAFEEAEAPDPWNSRPDPSASGALPGSR